MVFIFGDVLLGEIAQWCCFCHAVDYDRCDMGFRLFLHINTMGLTLAVLLTTPKNSFAMSLIYCIVNVCVLPLADVVKRAAFSDRRV